MDEDPLGWQCQREFGQAEEPLGGEVPRPQLVARVGAQQTAYGAPHGAEAAVAGRQEDGLQVVVMVAGGQLLDLVIRVSPAIAQRLAAAGAAPVLTVVECAPLVAREGGVHSLLPTPGLRRPDSRRSRQGGVPYLGLPMCGQARPVGGLPLFCLVMHAADGLPSPVLAPVPVDWTLAAHRDTGRTYVS